MNKPPARKTQRKRPASKKATGQKQQTSTASGKPKRRQPQRYRPMKPPKARCFFGIKFTLVPEIQPIRDGLALLDGGEAENVRLAPDQNLHITLKFLGSVEETNLPTLESILQEMAIRHAPLTLLSKGAGSFKNSCWVGIENHDALNALVKDLDTACLALGLAAEEKNYLPHVTVARFSKNAKPQFAPLLEKFKEQSWGEISVDKICLYRSDTLPEGARYTVISEAKLEKQTSSSES